MIDASIKLLVCMKSNMHHILVVLIACAELTLSQHNPNFFPNRSGIVHLFEWKFKDIARECETYLSPHGFAGVQVCKVKHYGKSENRRTIEISEIDD